MVIRGFASFFVGLIVSRLLVVSDDASRVAALLYGLCLRRLRLKRVTQGVDLLVLIVHVEFFFVEVFLEICLIILMSIPLLIVTSLPS